MSSAEGATRGGVPSRADEPLVSIGEGALERLPGLASIFEQTGAGFGRSLALYMETPVSVAFENAEALRVCDMAPAFGESAAVLAFHARGLEGHFLVVMDDSLATVAVEALLGSETPQADERPRTRIEDRLLGFFAQKLLEEFASAAAALGPISFERDRLAEEGALAALGRKGSVAILARFQCRANAGGGGVGIAAPRSAFDAHKETLSRPPGAEDKGQDERWLENLEAHVAQTELRVTVAMEADNVTLGDIARMSAGDILRLPVAPTSFIRAASEGRTLFWCSLGQKDGRYTVRVEEFSDERQSFIEELLDIRTAEERADP